LLFQEQGKSKTKITRAQCKIKQSLLQIHHTDFAPKDPKN